MKTRCMIVDDEPLAIEIIESYLDNLEGFDVVATCRNAVEAFDLIRTENIDLLFLDIQMPQLTGLDFLRSLQNPPKVILTTAHRDYALEGFELDVVDYLLKPISLERFLQAIDKYRTRSVSGKKQTADTTASPSIDVTVDRKTHRIPLQEIIYAESMKDYVKIFTTGQKYVVKMTLGNLLSELPDDRFIQIHRSYIVSLKHIKAFDATMIEIANRQLPIGGRYKHEVEAALKNNS